VVVALMLATGWLLSTPAVNTHPMTALPAWLGQQPWFAWALSLAVALLVWRTRLHLLWCLGAGAGLGALGWI
jgi:chromate transporter